MITGTALAAAYALVAVSTSQLCELIGVEPSRFVDIDRDHGKDRDTSRLWIVLEPAERATHMQTTGTNPPLHDNTIRRGPKGKGKGGRKGC